MVHVLVVEVIDHCDSNMVHVLAGGYDGPLS